MRIIDGHGTRELVDKREDSAQAVAAALLKELRMDRVHCECGRSIYAPAFRHDPGCTFRYAPSLAPRAR